MNKIVKLCLVLFVLCAFSAPVMGANWSEYTNATATVSVSDSFANTLDTADAGVYNAGNAMDWLGYNGYDSIDSIMIYSIDPCSTILGHVRFDITSGGTGGGYFTCSKTEITSPSQEYYMTWDFDSDIDITSGFSTFNYTFIDSGNPAYPFSSPAHPVSNLAYRLKIVDQNKPSMRVRGDVVSSVSSRISSDYSYKTIINDSDIRDTFYINVDRIGDTPSTWSFYNVSGYSYYDNATSTSDFEYTGLISNGVYAKIEIAGGAYTLLTLTEDYQSGGGSSGTPSITYYGTDLTTAVSSVKTDWPYSIKFDTAEFDSTTYRYFYNHRYPNGTLMLPSAYLDRQTSLVFPVWVDASALDIDPSGVYTTTLYRVPIAGGSSELLATSQLQVFDVAQSMTTVDITLSSSEYTVGDLLNYTVNFTNYDSASTYSLSIFGPEMLYYHVADLTGNATGSFLTYTGMLPGSYVIRVHESTPSYIENLNDPTSFVLLDYFDTTEPYINVSKSVFSDAEYTEIFGYSPSSKDYYVRVVTRIGAPYQVMNMPVVGYFNIDRSFDAGKYRAELYYRDFIGLSHQRDSVNFDVTSSELDIDWFFNGVPTTIYGGCAPLVCQAARLGYSNVTSSDIIEVFSPLGLYLSWNQADQPNSYDFRFPRGSEYEGEWIAKITNGSNSSDYITALVQFGDENNKWTGGFSSATLNWRIPLESDEWGELGSASRFKFVDTAYTTDDIELVWTATNLTNTHLRIFGGTVEYLNDTYSYTGGTIPMTFTQTDAVWAVITDDSGTVWARAKLDVSLGSGSGSSDGMGADDGGWLGSSDNNDSAIFTEGREAPNMLVGMYWAFGFLTKSELFAASFFATILLGAFFAYFTKNTLLVILAMELSMGVHVIFKMFPLSLLLISLVVISAFASKKLSGVTS